MPLSMKETPQSVSVITPPRMQDQNLSDFRSMMDQATGVSVVTSTNGPMAPSFYSRGYEITSIQIDGGPPINTAYNLFPRVDMGMYDHVEIRRGAAGLFIGYGDPSGSIKGGALRGAPRGHDFASLRTMRPPTLGGTVQSAVPAFVGETP